MAIRAKQHWCNICKLAYSIQYIKCPNCSHGRENLCQVCQQYYSKVHPECPSCCPVLPVTGTATVVQPAPTSMPDAPAIWALVIEDMHARDNFGLEKYSTRLQPLNGRVALTDVYQEVLDMAVYIKQELVERAWLKERLGVILFLLSQNQFWEAGEELKFVIGKIK